MIFSNVKFWRQACLLSLLFGAELFTLSPSLLLESECCQSWFVKKLFMYQILSPSLHALLLRLTGLNSIEAEIDITDFYLDLVSHLHIQVRLMGNLCLNSGIPLAL